MCVGYGVGCGVAQQAWHAGEQAPPRVVDWVMSTHTELLMLGYSQATEPAAWPHLQVLQLQQRVHQAPQQQRLRRQLKALLQRVRWQWPTLPG
jgi:hypothetical protein